MLDTTKTTALIPVGDLIAGFAFLKRSMDTRATYPILGNVAFPGDGTMRATDLDQEGVYNLPGATGHEPFTLSLAALQKALKGASKGTMVHFTPEGETVRVEADGLTSTMPGLPYIDFPSMTPVHSDTLLRGFEFWDAQEFRDFLRFLAPCISTEQTRYYLGGVYLHSQHDRLTGCATDGYKLAHKRLDMEWPTARHGVILPGKAVKALLAEFGKRPTGKVRVEIYKMRVVVRTDTWTLRTKVVDGTFPDYTRVIPSDHEFAVSVDADKLRANASRLAGLSSRGSMLVKVDSKANTISLQDADRGAHEMSLCAVAGSGDGEFGVNISYLKDALDTFEEVIASPSLTFMPGKQHGPVKITGVRSGLWVIMPMRL